MPNESDGPPKRMLHGQLDLVPSPRSGGNFAAWPFMSTMGRDQTVRFRTASVQHQTTRKRTRNNLKRQLGSKSICMEWVCPISIFSRFSWIVDRGWKQEHTLPREFGIYQSDFIMKYCFGRNQPVYE